MSSSLLTEAKEAGFSDRQIGNAIGVTEKDVREKRIEANIKPWVKQVGNTGGVASCISGEGEGVHIHIFVFCITNFF